MCICGLVNRAVLSIGHKSVVSDFMFTIPGCSSTRGVGGAVDERERADLAGRPDSGVIRVVLEDDDDLLVDLSFSRS